MAMHMAGLVGIIGRPQGVNSHSKKYFESWARGRPSRLSLVKSSAKFLLSTQIQNSPPLLPGANLGGEPQKIFKRLLL